MRFLLDLPLNVANARLHWTQKLRAKKAFYKESDQRQLLGLVPPPPEQPLASVELTAHFRLHNRMDRDNLAARLKFPLDWLVTRGYIVDDRESVIGTPTLTQEIDRKDPGLEITLEAK